MKKIIMALLVMALIIAVFILPAPAPSAEKPIVLKWTSHEPDAPGSTQNALKRMSKLIADKTEGRVSIRVFWGSVLGKPTDFLKMVGGVGVADGGFIIPTYHQWEIPLFAAPGLPFLTKGYKVGGLATWELYNEWPAMQEELKKVNVKLLWPFMPHPHWGCLDRPIQKFEDLKGKKMWVAGFWQQVLDTYGVINVPMAAPDAYDALQKGVISGILGMPYHTFKIFRFIEICKYLLELPFGGQPVVAQMMNLDVWNKIAPKDQKAIEEVISGMNDWYFAEVEKEEGALREFYTKQGVKHISLSPEDYAAFEKVGKDVVWNFWLKTAKGKGIPGEEFFKRYQAKVKAISK